MTNKKSPRAGRDGAGAKNTNINDDCTRAHEGGQAYSVTNAIKAIAAATERGELDSLEALVLMLFVGIWADYSTGSKAWPSMSTVATSAGISRRTAGRKVTSLVSKGWLVKMGDHATHQTTIYDVRIHADGCERGSQGVRTSFAGGVSDVRRGCEAGSQGGANLTTGGVRTSFAQPSHIPSPIPKEEKKQQHAPTRELEERNRSAVAPPTHDDSKPVHNPHIDDDDDPRPPVVMICEEVEVYVGEQPSHVLAEKVYAELRRRVAAKLRLQGKSSSPAKVVREWVRHKLLMSSDWAEREGASANRLVRVPAMGTDLEEWMDTRAGYDAATRKSRVPTKSLNQERAEQEARFFFNDDEEVA